jgi:hypothetical protein
MGIQKLFTALSAALLLFSSNAYAFSGTEAASFLDIPVGGRPAALGSAYSAEAADAYAPIYNPGGLGFLDSTQLAGMHISYLESINYEYVTFVHPLSIGHSIGLSAQYLNPGKTTSRNAAGDVTGDFGGHYGAYTFGYGSHVGDHVGIGAAAKLVEAQIAGERAMAYAFDAGALYRVNSHWSFATVVSNLGTKMKFIEQEDSLPLNGRLGVSFWPNKHWAFTADGIYRKNGLASGHAGAEWNPFEPISLRVGYRTDTTKELSAMAGFTTGVGVHAFGQEFDYAWVPMGDLGNTHYFSLVLRFSRAENEKRNLIKFREREANPNDIESMTTYYDPPMLDLDADETPQSVQTENRGPSAQ